MTKPIAKYQAGGCSAAIFQNQFQTPDGTRTASSVVLERTYKKDGSYHTAKTFGTNDIPKVIVVLQKAYEHIVTKKIEQKQEDGGGN